MDHDPKSGTSESELLASLIALLCTSCIHHWLTTRFSFIFLAGGRWLLFLAEFSLLSIPPLLITTYLGNLIIPTTVLLCSICLFLFKSRREMRALRLSVFHEFKVLTLINTSAAIASVDCKRIFEARFAKTQIHGFSPMDLGTGLFVALRAISLLREDLRKTAKRESDVRDSKLDRGLEQESFLSRMPRFLPFLVLGLARTLFIVSSGYYQDPIEYGVHWNFFLTLAAIEIFLALVRRLTRNDLAVPTVAFLIGASYFLFLLTTDLESYLLGLETKRNGLLDANREGIFSTLGYLFIFGLTYLVNRFCAPTILWTDSLRKPINGPNVRFALCRNFVAHALIYACAQYKFGLPSRRSANLVYSLQIHFVVNIITLLIYAYQHCVGKPMTGASQTTQLPTLHSAISRNGAYFFLAANIFTGLLNYCRSFMSTGPQEFTSLAAYMFVLCISTRILDATFYSPQKRRSL